MTTDKRVNNLIPGSIAVFGCAVFYAYTFKDWVGTSILIATSICMFLAVVIYHVAGFLNKTFFGENANVKQKGVRWNDNGQKE